MSKRRLTKKERDARDAQWLASIRRSIEEGNSIFNQGLAAALQMYGAMRGQLASVLHGVWAHWTGYMLSVGQENEDGSVTIPAEYVERWRRQMETPSYCFCRGWDFAQPSPRPAPLSGPSYIRKDGTND